MKKYSFWFVLSLILLVSQHLFAEINPKPFVIPELKEWHGANGKWLPSGRILLKGNEQELRQMVIGLISDYQEITGKSLLLAKGRAQKGDIVIALKKHKEMEEEGYEMEIGDQLLLTAASPQGIYWGTRTLLQLSEQSVTQALPKGHIADAPEYPLRGFMMDCGRKFIPMSYLRNLVKIMAYYKMNTLQLHLNDNGFVQYFGNDWSKTYAAFRLESDTYPGLAAKDGHYSKAEFVELQHLAEAHGVEIIPEIDVPAHSLAFSHYRPEIGSKEYGMDHLDLFNPATYEFVDGLFKEYLEGPQPVFCGKRVHIGTDEYSNAKKEVVEQFRAFTDHYIRYVESFGKQAMCWGALTHAQGNTAVKSDNVVMSCWYNGYADPKDMQQQGYQLVSIPDGWVYIVPAAGYYYDYLNCAHLYNTWTPAHIGNQRFEENDPSVLGGMFAVWNDHVGNGITVKDIHHRLLPALQTLSSKCWTGQHVSLPYAEFDSLRHTLSEAPGANENALYGIERKAVLNQSVVLASSSLPLPEIGYDYTVTFDVDVQTEDKGTILFQSPHAVFYLSDPKTGRLGFAREGYLNTFNYRLPVGQQVNISIEGNNRQTILYVNGKRHQEMGPLTVYAVQPHDQLNVQDSTQNEFIPEVYAPETKMFYQRTLVFPLAKTGQFNSQIRNLKVLNYQKNK